MAFQRSYSKVWWGSDNQLTGTNTTSGINGSSLTSGGFYYSLYSEQQQQQLPHNAGYNHNAYHSLDYNNGKSAIGNLSRIQEVDDENNVSKLSWEKQYSPGSLRSQDSGFSDNDESHSTRSMGGRSSKAASPSAKSDISARSSSSPSTSIASSTQTIATPPTVVRRVGKSQFYSPLVSVSRRISFTGSPAKRNAEEAETAQPAAENGNAHRTAKQLDFDGAANVNDASIRLQTSPKDAEAITASHNTSTSSNNSSTGGNKQFRRRKRVVRKATRPITTTRQRVSMSTMVSDSDEDDAEAYNDTDVGAQENSGTYWHSDELLAMADQSQNATDTSLVPAYNNETVYLGEAPPPYNNETVVLGSAPDVTLQSDAVPASTPIKPKQRFMVSTSTPKAMIVNEPASSTTSTNVASFVYEEYENPLLNGHAPDLQCWLQDMRHSYDQEVMSTLQTKSIAQEAFKNLTITTNTVAKLIRQLQQRALYMQSDFERIERILCGTQAATLNEALASADQLLSNVCEFTKVLERRAVFFSDTRAARKKYDDNIEQIRIVIKDTRYSLERQHYINLESLLDDLQVLRRFLLITVRLVFERMVRVIVQSIEHSRCDLMLRANINMIATLTNIDYDGFASLTDAFVHNEAVRTLLMVCLDHKLSSVRALALRALATICCARVAIVQLGECGGIEILRDILHVEQQQRVVVCKRTDTERREAVSLLTQITAGWHGPEHRVAGLKDCVETIVEGLTDLLTRSQCSQTLLLCAAALNNLSRIEATTHYSIMSNEAIFKLIETIENNKQTDITIFHYEQIVSMLHNMSWNKKCHSHLANGIIINFITSAYQTEFYKSYNSRAESDAQRRTIKAILHTLTRLVHDTSLGAELFAQQRIPEFFRLAIAAGASYDGEFPIPMEQSHSRDITMLTRQFELAKNQENGASNDAANSNEHSSAGRTTTTTAALKLNLARQESYV